MLRPLARRVAALLTTVLAVLAAVVVTVTAGCPSPAAADAGRPGDAATGGDAGAPADPAADRRAEAALQKALADKSCPDGTRRIGAEPPEGNETWCERPAPAGTDKPIRHGPYDAWHPDGVKSVRGTYADGARDGAWVLWHPNGQRHQEWHYTRGVPDGPFREWDASGSIVADVVYKQGKVSR